MYPGREEMCLKAVSDISLIWLLVEDLKLHYISLSWKAFCASVNIFARILMYQNALYLNAL